MPPTEIAHKDDALGSINPSAFVLSATDNYPLAAKLWVNSALPSPAIAAVINAGAGVGSRYYDRFAQFLAGVGVPTLIYDYRGIGQSRPRSLRNFSTSVEEWGSKDCAAALTWLAAQFPGAKRLVIGHSVGGFVTGFVTNGRLIDKLVLIGAHTGYWRDYSPWARPSMYLLWHLLMPALTRAVGYFPGRMLRLIDDLPAGVALEWANRRQPDFWLDKGTPNAARDRSWQDEVLSRFRAIHARTLAVRFTDDPFGTEVATSRILNLYENCVATTMTIEPIAVGGQKIGHFGFFRSRFRDTLWVRVAEWLREPQSGQGAA